MSGKNVGGMPPAPTSVRDARSTTPMQDVRSARTARSVKSARVARSVGSATSATVGEPVRLSTMQNVEVLERASPAAPSSVVPSYPPSASMRNDAQVVSRGSAGHTSQQAMDAAYSGNVGTLAADHYYVPSQCGADEVEVIPPIPPSVRPARGMAPDYQAELVHAQPRSMRIDIAPRLPNIVTVTSASGGVGTTTLAALLTKRFGDMAARNDPVDADYSCTLVDADLRTGGGGLDVLLGAECELGMRWHGIDAPLGQLDGEVLRDELVNVDGIKMLPFHSWKDVRPHSWEVQAAIQALSHVESYVVVDAADGDCLTEVDELARAMHIVVVEMSVLGVARARSHIEWLRSLTQESEQAARRMSGSQGVSRRAGQRHQSGQSTDDGLLDDSDDDGIVAVGIAPRGARMQDMLPLDEAQAHLDMDIIGPFKPHKKLASDLVEGLGLLHVPKSYNAMLDEIIMRIIDEVQLRHESCSGAQ